MKKATGSIPSNTNEGGSIRTDTINKYNIRQCPSCGMMSIAGMPGGRDATCTNCGYKDPCCYD